MNTTAGESPESPALFNSTFGQKGPPADARPPTDCSQTASRPRETTSRPFSIVPRWYTTIDFTVIRGGCSRPESSWNRSC
eukprot:gene26169-biopygen14582